MKTVLYLMRHGTTTGEQGVWTPHPNPALQEGREHGRVASLQLHNLPLAPLGVRQAEATRDFLAIRPIDQCYCSPLLRAVQTAAIVAAPHGLTPQPLQDLAEYHLVEPGTQACRRESLADRYGRVAACLEALLKKHAGEALLVVAHRLVNQIYLAGLLGLPGDQALQVNLDNCGISVVVREGQDTMVSTLNAAFHLQGVAA